MFKPLNQYPQTALSEEQSQVLLMLLMTKDDPGLQRAAEGDQICKIIAKRVELANGSIEPQLQVLISVLSEGNPGKAIMMAHAMHMATPIGEASTVSSFCEVFPMGIPNDDVWGEAWDGQKGEIGNLVDNTASWERPQ